MNIWTFLFFELPVNELVISDSDVARQFSLALGRYAVRVPIQVASANGNIEKPGPEFPSNYFTVNWPFRGTLSRIEGNKYALIGALQPPPMLRLMFKAAYWLLLIFLIGAMSVALARSWHAGSKAALVDVFGNAYRFVSASWPIVLIISAVCLAGSLASRGQRRRIIEAFHAM